MNKITIVLILIIGIMILCVSWLGIKGEKTRKNCEISYTERTLMINDLSFSWGVKCFSDSEILMNYVDNIHFNQ
jgi:hypothetical protein